MVVSKPQATGKIQPAPSWSTRTRGAKGRPGGKDGIKQTTTAAPVSGSLDLTNRDPKGTNAHVKVLYEDVMAEPHTAPYSTDCVWKLSISCYTCWRNCCYRMFTLFCAVPLAFVYGCHFAIVTCPCVWICTPCMKVNKMICYGCSRLSRQCLNCSVAPFFAACGGIFWAFGAKREPVLPYTRANARGNGNDKSSKVKFNERVNTKFIPGRNQNNGTQLPSRRTSVVPPKSNSVPMNVKPAGKQITTPRGNNGATQKVGIGSKGK